MKKILLLGLLVSSPGLAEDKLRDLCAERPGLDTPACTVDPGHLQVEVGLGDWTLDRQSGNRTDTILLGDISARYGVGESTEIRLGGTAEGRVRTRRATCQVGRSRCAAGRPMAMCARETRPAPSIEHQSRAT